MKMYGVKTHDYGHGVVSHVLTLPDKHTCGRYISITIDTDGSVMFPSMDHCVSLGVDEVEAIKSFLDIYTK